MVSSLRMQAVRATFLVLPAAKRRVYKAWRTGLRRLPTRAAMYKAARTVARPPQIVRLPRMVPLSRLIGARPTNAATCLRSRVPSSGRSASSVTLTTGPMPGTLRSRSSCSRQSGLARTAWLSSLSTPFRRLRSHVMCSWMSERMALALSCGGSPQRSASRPAGGGVSPGHPAPAWRHPGNGRTAGRTASAKWASTWASMASVLASLPIALAKSRTWRGLTATTGSPALPSAANTASSKPPVASSTINVG